MLDPPAEGPRQEHDHRWPADADERARIPARHHAERREPVRPGQPVTASDVPRRGRVPMRRALAAALLVLLAYAGARAAQPSIRHVYRTAPALIGLPTVAFDERYQNAADVVLEQAIRNLPLFPGASSAFTYRWNPEHSRLELVDDAVAPWLVTERGQKIGRAHV